LRTRLPPETPSRLINSGDTGRPLGEDDFVDTLDVLLDRKLKRRMPGPKKKDKVSPEYMSREYRNIFQPFRFSALKKQLPFFSEFSTPSTYRK
jgi:hypothetical protein